MKNSQKMLEKIHSRKVVQKSRLGFVLKNSFFWIIFSLSVIVGTISFSIIIFAFSQSEYDIISHISHSRIEFIMGFLPLFWIIFCIIFLLISFFGIRYTKTGYRYPVFIIFSSSFIFSLIFGVVLFFSGGAEKIELIFSKNVSMYKSIEEKKIMFWSMPKNGFLSGIINNKIGDIIFVKGFNGNNWQIKYNDAVVRGKIELEKGDIIKIIGKLENNIFIAKEIRPWKGQGNNSLQGLK